MFHTHFSDQNNSSSLIKTSVDKSSARVVENSLRVGGYFGIFHVDNYTCNQKQSVQVIYVIGMYMKVNFFVYPKSHKTGSKNKFTQVYTLTPNGQKTKTRYFYPPEFSGLSNKYRFLLFFSRIRGFYPLKHKDISFVIC